MEDNPIMTSIVYRIPEMDQIEIKSDLIYKHEQGKNYLFDICFPLNYNNTTNYPTVILISGGSNSSLTLNDEFRKGFLSWGRLLAASRLLTIHFLWNYKRPEDIVDMIQFIRKNADKYNVDKNRISTFSFSRGVGRSFKTVINANSGYLKSMVAYYGKIPVSIGKMDKVNIPPVFIAFAGKDKFFSPDCNDEFIASLKKRNIEVISVAYETGEHAFDMRNHDEKSIEIIKQTISFLMKHTI
jgi:hypothetical protein